MLLAAEQARWGVRRLDLIEAKGQELDENEINTQLGAYKMEPNPEGDLQRRMIKLKVDDWVRVRPGYIICRFAWNVFEGRRG